MKVTLEDGRLVIAPSNDGEAEALADWHSEYSASKNPDLYFKQFEKVHPGMALILKA